MPGMQAASASQRALFDCKRSKHSAVVQSQPEVWQPPKDYLSALPTDILLIIFKFVIADSEISCRREFEKWKIKAPNKYVTDQTRVTEFCSCMPEGPGRKGPRMPADYITLLVISKKLNSVVNDNAAFVELMCAKRLLIGKVEHARILVMVEEFRDLNERQEDALPATEHDFAKLRHRINNEPYTRQLVRKMIKAEHYVREILYFTTCYEYELIHSPEDYKPPYAKGGLTPTNIRFLTEAMLGRWNLMRKDKKIEACLEWVISKYFRGHGEKPFESRGHREDPPGFGGHDGAPIDWDELEQEYSYQSGKSTIKSITETLLFDFWQIDEEEMRVECTDFSYNECYARWDPIRQKCQDEAEAEFISEGEGGFKQFICDADLKHLIWRVRTRLWDQDANDHYCQCMMGNYYWAPWDHRKWFPRYLQTGLWERIKRGHERRRREWEEQRDREAEERKREEERLRLVSEPEGEGGSEPESHTSAAVGW